MRKLASAVLGVMLAVTTVLAGTAAHGAEPRHPDIEYALAHQPGGVVVDESTVVWPLLGMTLQLQEAHGEQMGIQSVGPCPTGRVCAFRSNNLAGTMLSWISCGYFSTSALPGVGSIANARSSGTFQALNGASVVATVGANSWTNVFGAVTNVRCSL